MKLNISDPVIISMGPDSRTAGWGPYQFPDLFKLPDGTLMCAFNNFADSETAYGTERSCFVSADNGATWIQAMEKDFASVSGLLLPNGDRIRFYEQPSIPLDSIDLSGISPINPEKLGRKQVSYYRWEDISPEISHKTWRMHRVTPGNPEGVTEEVTLNWPHQVFRACRGVLITPQPRGKLRLGPDGAVWMTHYDTGCDPQTGELNPYHANYLFRSTDNGSTWDLIHYLPFFPAEHQLACEGYGENDITFAPDGSLVRIVRSKGVYKDFEKYSAESYILRSTDGGKIWSDPAVFDDRGVWPVLLTLKCGVTLCGYGRPGFFIRATEDPACLRWDDRIEIVHSSGEPEPYEGHITNRATCSYCDLVPLDDHTAGLVYSDFTVRDENDIPRKCMMFRTIKVER